MLNGSSFLLSIILILVMTTLEKACLRLLKTLSINTRGSFLQRLLEANSSSVLTLGLLPSGCQATTITTF